VTLLKVGLQDNERIPLALRIAQQLLTPKIASELVAKERASCR